MRTALAVILLCSAVASGAPTTQPDAAGRLIEQLSAEAWAERQAAEEALVRLGPQVRAAVERALAATDDLEARLRLQTVLGRLEHERAFGVSRITLDLENATAAEVLAEISRQANATVRVADGGGNAPARSRFRLDDQPFWSAIDEVGRVYGLFPYESGQAGELLLARHGRRRGAAPTITHGPFRIVLDSVNHRHSVDLTSPRGAQASSTLQMRVMAEPKLTILGRSYQPVLTQAINERGESLVPPQRGEAYGDGAGSIWMLNVPLAPEASKSRRLAVLAGSFEVTLQERSETLEVGDLPSIREQSHTVGGRRVIFHGLNEKEGNWSLHVTVFLPPQEAMGAGHSSLRGLKVLDEQGRAFPSAGMGGRGFDGQKLEVELLFRRQQSSKLGRPTRLVWTIPTRTRVMQVPFEFRDVPLQ